MPWQILDAKRKSESVHSGCSKLGHFFVVGAKAIRPNAIAFLGIFFSVFHMAFAHLEPTYFLRGTIGDRNVGVQIDHFSEVVYLKYFYQDERVNIILKGQADSTSFFFENEYYNGQNDRPQVMRLKHLKDESWSGDWIAGNDTIAVFLKPIVKEEISPKCKSSFLSSLDPYGYLRTSDLVFEDVGESTIGEQQLIWVREPISGIEFFRIAEPSKGVMSELQHKLTAQHLIMVENYFECGTYGFSGSYKVEVDVHFIDEHYLSYSVDNTYGCFSEKVNQKTDHYTIDIGTGKTLSLDDIIYLGEGTVPRANSSDWFKYRREEFSPFVINQLKKLYPTAFESKEGCDVSNTKAWQQPSWYLTQQGLYLGANFPGIDRSCNGQGWSIIPYKKLKKYFVGGRIK